MLGLLKTLLSPTLSEEVIYGSDALQHMLPKISLNWHPTALQCCNKNIPANATVRVYQRHISSKLRVIDLQFVTKMKYEHSTLCKNSTVDTTAAYCN